MTARVRFWLAWRAVGRAVRLGPYLPTRDALADLWRDVSPAFASLAVALVAAYPVSLRVGINGDGLDVAVPASTPDVPARILDVLCQVRPARLTLR